MDPVPRTAPEAMAVDEWLLGMYKDPILRVYRWQGEWGTIGYFDRLQSARDAFPGLELVRRWTGGGTVDHRNDWAYTLVIPGGGGVGRKFGGADSYREIHGALATALQQEGRDAQLSCGDRSTGAALCFENPVCHDLVDSSGRKLAGAGQRRNKQGMMHQGSVALPADESTSRLRAQRLAGLLANDWQELTIEVPPDWLEATCAMRYGQREWTERRM